ncbi:hypothetical protein H5410_063825 [Solanum commersonii]|uniref:Uncharacterized protein n=1 Tax=Solanum commersonii TaxID=4109 RepID=A0A9J5WE95_SOLCO|nr:hypothetical protein H5410_063825 [Solanum commersonii]
MWNKAAYRIRVASKGVGVSGKVEAIKEIGGGTRKSKAKWKAGRIHKVSGGVEEVKRRLRKSIRRTKT